MEAKDRSFGGNSSLITIPKSSPPSLPSAIRCARAALILSTLRSRIGAAANEEDRLQYQERELQARRSMAALVSRARLEKRELERVDQIDKATKVLVAVVFLLAFCAYLGLGDGLFRLVGVNGF